jgi:hypothetical protein
MHVEVEIRQSTKRPDEPCGDVVQVERTASSTMIVLADGLGSGVKANLAATMCVARLMELVRRDYSIRHAFTQVVRSMNEARGVDGPYAAFSVMQVLPEGDVSILTYEMPSPILLYRHNATILEQQMVVRDQAMLGESVCRLAPGDGLMLMSDGITQAGLGAGFPMGWGSDGVCQFVTELVSRSMPSAQIADEVHDQALEYWMARRGRHAGQHGDDCSVVLATCRAGVVVNLFTGPPASPASDAAVVKRFRQSGGALVVCGATTAKLVAQCMGKPVEVARDAQSLVAPPHYHIDGIDLVTEGAVTLNQVYNIVDEDPSSFSEDSGVTRLCEMLNAADRVNFLMGQARNEASGDIHFRQQGILPRQKILPLLADKLTRMGKLVVMEEC